VSFFLGSLYAETRLRSGLLGGDVQKTKALLSETQKGFIALGGSMVLGGLALAKFATGGIEAAAQVETAVTNAASVTGLQAGPQFVAAVENMTAVARKIGRETTISATDAADALYDLASQGFDVAKLSAQNIIPLVDLATTSQSDLSTATQFVTENLKVFGLGLDDAQHFSDVFAQSIGQSAATLPID